MYDLNPTPAGNCALSLGSTLLRAQAHKHCQSQVNHDKYGLVLSDLRMPGMNGYEFIKKVKEIKPEVKVFFMTAFEIDDIEFRRVLPSVKIDEFIQKPISLERLITLVRNHTTIN